MDRNQNGSLDVKEIGLEATTFAKLDTDGNGNLTPAEIARWRALPANMTWQV